MKQKLGILLSYATILFITLPPASAGQQHYTAAEGLPHPMISALAVQEGRVWAGSNQGLAVKTLQAKSFTSFSGQTLGKVIAIIPQHNKALIACNQGIFRADAAKRSLAPLTLPPHVTPDQITCLKQSPGKTLWLGTRQGLFTSSETRIQWQPLALPETAGMVHHIAFSGSLVFVSTENTSLYVYATVLKQWITAIPLETGAFITALSVYGTTLYLGTHGKGLYQYDWQQRQLTKIFPQKDRNEFIHAAITNGENAWFGTFNRLLKVNQAMGTFQERSLPFPSPSSINCFALSTTDLYIGTEFGILVQPLKKPRLALQVDRSICFDPKRTLKLSGTASESSRKTLVLDFSNRTLATVWFKESLSLSSPANRADFTGQWNITGLPDKNNFYLLRVRATDPQGKKNSTVLPILIATEKPAITLNRTNTKHPEGLRSFSGKFNTWFVDTLQVTPGDMPAEIEIQKNAFRSTVTLNPGSNTVRAVLSDWFGRSAKDQITIQVAQKSSENAVIVKAGKQKGEEIIVLSEALIFDSGQAEITPSGLEALTKVADYMLRDDAITARIIGHTDNRPIANRKFANNRALSEARAHTVFNYLSKKKALSPDRFTIIGKGAADPIADNQTQSGRKKNRRVEIVLKKVE
ncbi:OmpA family protein [bacterium]|nr:OmpA family protein [bacterium]